jgi:hypothetical protein
MVISANPIKGHKRQFYSSATQMKNHPNELTPKSWTSSPTKVVLRFLVARGGIDWGLVMFNPY